MKKAIFFSFCTVLFLNNSFVSQNEKSIELESLFGDLRGRHIGPASMSGRIIDMELHPKNERVIYAGTAGGGVWKSNNSGTTFFPIFDSQKVPNIESFLKEMICV